MKFFDMGQWFRISSCLKIYFVIELVTGHTVQQSILVCSILVEGVLRNNLCDIICATDSESCLIYNGHVLSIGQLGRCIMRNISVNSKFVSKQHEEITDKFKQHVATLLSNM